MKYHKLTLQDNSEMTSNLDDSSDGIELTTDTKRNIIIEKLESFESEITSNNKDCEISNDEFDCKNELDLLRLENIALPMSYCLIGACQGITTAVIPIYLLRLNATEAQQITIFALQSLPASFKIVFGLVSDYYPIFGYRRKVYMMFGWILSSIAMGLTYKYDVYYHRPINERTEGSNSEIHLLALYSFLFGFGIWLGDCIADAILSEKCKLESENDRGKLQSTCLGCRYFTLFLCIAITTYTADYIPARFYFVFLMILPWLSIIPSAIYMKESRSFQSLPISTILNDVWSTISTPSVLSILNFVFFNTILQVGNSSWNQYLYSVLKFQSLEINSYYVIIYFLLYISIMVYKKYLRHTNFHYTFYFCAFFKLCFLFTQLILLKNLNSFLHLPGILFGMSDTIADEYVYGIESLPTNIVFASLCPHGSEGTTYALFLSFNNCAVSVAASLSNILLSIFDVSKSTLIEGNVQGIINLTILTACIKFLSVVFIPLFPRNLEELKQWKQMDETTQRKGLTFLLASVFLLVIILSIVMSVATSYFNVFHPGYLGDT